MLDLNDLVPVYFSSSDKCRITHIHVHVFARDEYVHVEPCYFNGIYNIGDTIKDWARIPSLVGKPNSLLRKFMGWTWEDRVNETIERWQHYLIQRYDLAKDSDTVQAATDTVAKIKAGYQQGPPSPPPWVPKPDTGKGGF